MKGLAKTILIDICHPAHVHFFRNPIRILKDRGHAIFLTSRKKEVITQLLDDQGLSHQTISEAGGNSLTSLAKELFHRDKALVRFSRNIKPDLITAVGGTFAAHAGFLTRTPSVVFYDTETAILQNLITYPFADLVVVPECYSGWLPRNSLKYKGFQETSYLHPNYFTPDVDIAILNGLDSNRPTILLRTVAWAANHDIGKTGMSTQLIVDLVSHLNSYGKVILCSESEPPPELETYRYNGRPGDLHHLLAFCSLHVGEGATLATEAALLGVPTVYCAKQRLANMIELEKNYSALVQVTDLSPTGVFQAIDMPLERLPTGHSAKCKKALFPKLIDVAMFVADTIESKCK